jgi:hypothetical protein
MGSKSILQKGRYFFARTFIVTTHDEYHVQEFELVLFLRTFAAFFEAGFRGVQLLF